MKRVLSSLIVFLGMMASSHATVDTIQLYSKYLHKNAKFVIVQPEQQALQNLRSVYLLHGYGGGYATWPNIAPQLQQRSNEMHALIICPDGANSWYFDSPLDSTMQYESYIIKELIPYIDAHYSTIAHPSARAITGLSMGGHGGLYLAIHNLGIFGAAGSTSGGVDFRPFPNNWKIKNTLGEYQTNAAIWDERTVMTQVDHLKNKDLSIIVDCGVDDFFLTVNRNLHEKLLRLKIDHDYTERPGAHNNIYWKSSIDYQLLFFKKYFEQGMDIRSKMP